MKNWYKVLSLILIAVMSFSLVACNFTGTTPTDGGSENVGSDVPNVPVNDGEKNQNLGTQNNENN